MAAEAAPFCRFSTVSRKRTCGGTPPLVERLNLFRPGRQKYWPKSPTSRTIYLSHRYLSHRRKGHGSAASKMAEDTRLDVRYDALNRR
jgi:hypothetical protein